MYQISKLIPRRVLSDRRVFIDPPGFLPASFFFEIDNNEIPR